MPNAETGELEWHSAEGDVVTAEQWAEGEEAVAEAAVEEAVEEAVAEELVISPATARTHVSRAMVKIAARDRAQLVVFAYESGLVTPRREAV